jgi:hypothetical protein
LSCRFDFQHRAWSLPNFDDPKEAEKALTIFARGLLSKSVPVTSNNSDPALGGITPSKIPIRRMGVRPSRRRSLGKTKPSIK